MLAKPNRKRRTCRLTLTAVVRKEGRWYVAERPEVGVVSQGRTLEAAVKNLKEATDLFRRVPATSGGWMFSLSHSPPFE